MIKTIMSVDNESTTVELIKHIFEKEGYRVVTALSGKECLKKLEKEKVDLILLDVMMPDMSGWDVFEKIRKTDKKTKIIFLSILEVSPNRKREMLEGGVSDYITKPFEPKYLVERVKAALK
jgi:DNA-binding response OmpR family regulator